MSDLIRRLRLNSQDNPALGNDRMLYAEAADEIERLSAELEQIRAKAAAQGKYACEMFDECKRAQLAERDATKRAETAESKNTQLMAQVARMTETLHLISELACTNAVRVRGICLSCQAKDVLADLPTEAEKLVRVIDVVKKHYEIPPTDCDCSFCEAYRNLRGGE